jgi:hypothetical protein
VPREPRPTPDSPAFKAFVKLAQQVVRGPKDQVDKKRAALKARKASR